MPTFAEKAEEATSGDKPAVLGIVAVGIDRDGNFILSQTSGKTSLKEDAKAIDMDSILSIASCTKLITSLGALQLVQSGLVSLDDTAIIEKHLPELCTLEVITSPKGQDLELEKRTKPFTLRQLLTHSSGSAYDALDPRLLNWRAQRGETPLAFSGEAPYAIETPSVFQPGEGWAYGASLDWTGLLIERVSGKPLFEYMRTEIFDVVGCDSRVGYGRKELGEWVQTVTREEDGTLVDKPWPERQKPRGGGGLYCSSRNMVKVLADLIAPEPKLLSKEMSKLLFSPQFDEDSKPLAGIRGVAPVLKSMTGELTGIVDSSSINHALGGILITEDNPSFGKTKGTMAWGGAFNCLWFANRDTGVAGFYGSSMFPPGEPKSSELNGSFVREIWDRIGGKKS